MDVLAIILFYIGMGLKFKFDTGSRAVLAFALVMWIVKFSQFYRMIHSLGPYLTMVYRMVSHNYYYHHCYYHFLHSVGLHNIKIKSYNKS